MLETDDTNEAWCNTHGMFHYTVNADPDCEFQDE